MRIFFSLILTIFTVFLLAGCNFSGRVSSSEIVAAPLSQSASQPQEPSAAPPRESSAASGSQNELSSPDMTPPQILTLTVPEGYTLPRIGMLLEEHGFCTAEAFIDAAQNGDYSSYSLVAAQQPDDRRCFKLEGYLFPDTYEIYANDPPEAVVRRMLAHLEQKLDTPLREKISASGYTVDEILALASIIEKEAFGHEQMPLISSVLHNRMELGMQLQCDVTITYVEGAIKPFITGDINRYNGFYNTYKCEALPAGAICNPGLDAIRAALSPADTDYLYFVTDAEQNYYYSDTWQGHVENLEKAGLG